MRLWSRLGFTVAAVLLVFAAAALAAAETPVFSSEQEYSGEIPFENSKNVTLKMTLSADLKRVTKIAISGKEIELTPAHFDRQRKAPGRESIFKYSERSEMQTNFAITTVNGYNVIATDASGRSKIENLQFKGGIETTEPIDVAGNKIVLDERPFICNLSVTKAEIHGQVKLELNGCGTKSVYAVLKNTTTPQD